MSSKVKPSKKRQGLILVRQYSRGYWNPRQPSSPIGFLHMTQAQIDKLGEDAKFVKNDEWDRENKKRELEMLTQIFGPPAPVERVPFTGYMDMIKKSEKQ